MDIDETIEAFRNGAIELDCKKIELRQHKNGGEYFEGQGYIRQSQDGTLKFKMYVTKFENASPFAHIATRMNRGAGKLYTDDVFYDLMAVGRDGTTWTATRILPSPSWVFARAEN